MLHVDFQTKHHLDVGDVLRRPKRKLETVGLVSQGSFESTDAQPANRVLESKAQNLDHQVEERLFNHMRTSGLSALLIFADHQSLIEPLKNIILEIEEELHKYHPVDETRTTANDLDLFGAIDALETLIYIADFNKIFSKTNRLKRRLSEWAPPTYLIINSLNKFIKSPSINLVEADLVLKLKKAATVYAHYRNRMTQANLRLVYSVANKYRHLGLPYEDLVQEGNLGLIKAVERFDFSKGFRFSTYAHIVISQSIHLAIDKQASLVRLPFKALREKAVVEKVRQKLEQSLGRTPSIRELNKRLPNELEYKSAHIAAVIVPNASSQQLYLSPDDPELIERYSSREEDLKTSSLSHSDIIYSVLDRLNEREAYIVRMRFGIGLNKEFTLEEISQTIGLSRERVRQVAHQAIEKLSRYCENGAL